MLYFPEPERYSRDQTRCNRACRLLSYMAIYYAPPIKYWHIPVVLMSKTLQPYADIQNLRNLTAELQRNGYQSTCLRTCFGQCMEVQSGVLKFNPEDWTSILSDPRFKIQDPWTKLARNLESWIREYWRSILGIELQYSGELNRADGLCEDDVLYHLCYRLSIAHAWRFRVYTYTHTE